MYKRRLLPSNKGNSLLYFLIMVKASEAVAFEAGFFTAKGVME
jgi:hypothetical protein